MPVRESVSACSMAMNWQARANMADRTGEHHLDTRQFLFAESLATV